MKYVCGFYFAEGQVLMIKRTSTDFMEECWNGLGGIIEEGETPLKAMEREFEEKCGIKNCEWQIAIANRDCIFFRCFGEKQPVVEGPLKWFYVRRPPEDIPYDLVWLLPFLFNEDVTDWETFNK